MKEEWRPIKDFEGIYEVSNLGKVKSLRRDVLSKHPNQLKLFVDERILRLVRYQGYNRVYLYKDGVKHSKRVYRLVAEAFLPRIEGKNYVNHRDSDRANDCVSNLEWCTHEENIKHAREFGNARALKGSNMPQSKLTEIDVRKIKKRLKLGHKHRDIAKDFGVSRGPICKISRGIGWRHVSES